MRCSQRVALVTSAGSGIGREAALRAVFVRWLNPELAAAGDALIPFVQSCSREQ